MVRFTVFCSNSAELFRDMILGFFLLQVFFKPSIQSCFEVLIAKPPKVYKE